MNKKRKINQDNKQNNIGKEAKKEKEMSPEEIFKQIASLSSCDCSSCPKKCFDK
jgi:hypothetical protein